MTSPVFTIGHSTRTIGEFVRLLQAGGVALVADIRRIPKSRANPQYNGDVLGPHLLPFQIGTCRIAELGGLRKKTGIPETVNSFWSNRSFHNYADYALSDEFKHGLAELVARASRQPTAIMCAEALWWRCHRRIVADYLMVAGLPVCHLMDGNKVIPARLTPGAVPGPDGIHYPARV